MAQNKSFEVDKFNLIFLQTLLDFMIVEKFSHSLKYGETRSKFQSSVQNNEICLGLSSPNCVTKGGFPEFTMTFQWRI